MITRRRVALAVGLGLLLAGAAATRRLEPSVGLQSLSLVAPDGSSIPALRISPLDPRRVRGHALLLHGVTASKETLVPFAEALALTGLDCLAVDFPGHGESTAGFGDPAGLIGTAMAGAKFLAAAEPLDVLVGHSMGAYVAAEGLAAGQLHARRFIALGAAADPGEAKTTPRRSSATSSGSGSRYCESMALVKLMSAGTHPEAQLVKGLLETEGIPSVIHGESRGTDMGTEAGFAEISVLVNEEQLVRARLLLEATAVPDEPVKSGAVPEGAVCPVHEQEATRICSRCGSYLCASCGLLGVPPVCEACNDRLSQQPRSRSKTKLVAALLLLLFLLGIPMVAAAVIQAFFR